MKTTTVVLASLLGMMSCNTDTNNVNVPNPETSKEMMGQPSSEEANSQELIDESATKIGFGAFKTTGKIEVKGWFKDFKLEGLKQDATSWEEVIAGVTVEIDVPSVETNDTSRNAKVLKYFFGSTTSSELIKGQVLSVDSNSVEIEIEFNGIKKSVEFSSEISSDTLSLMGVIDVADFDALPAIEAINSACESLHKGADGISKTWSEVNLYISTILKEK